MANIVLIGFMGSGKSTIGSALAQKMGRFLLDTDSFIQTTYNQRIPEIFAQYGEQKFRELESQAIAWLSTNVSNAIIATGGGMPIFNDISTLGEIYYLQSDFETILARLDHQERSKRPLFSDQAQAKALYLERQNLYAKVAHHTINANNDIPEILTEILTRHNASSVSKNA
ncbi:shikimate kinase [uncultured Helicobacter sp.]|uniref:shikimate kinase n=1 Tax=uncultured Helicobacter sp. TaxID=175537 RepID=UPI003752CF19